MSNWIRKKKNSEKLLPFFKAIKEDIKKQLRYKYTESIIRNFPGNLGLWLRYHLLKKSFKKIGNNVLIWQGIRIKHIDKIEVGDNAQLGYDNHYQASGGLKIGKNTLIGPNVNIWTINHIYSQKNKPITEQGNEKKEVKIGDNCWITSMCFILPGASIPNGCVILPNSVVGVMKIPPNSVISGNPAKIICSRLSLGKFKK